MVNVGSISDQTLAGIVTTATHGSGITYGVMSTHVIAMTLLLADGTRVTCSRQESADLFVASICGLGSTGLILTIQLEVRSAFRLKEVQETVDFDYGMKRLDDIVSSAEHVRLWWFPTVGALRVNCADSTREARKPNLLYQRRSHACFQPKSQASSWLWHSLCGHHVVQFLLFIARYFPFLIPFVARFSVWLIRDPTVRVDDSYSIFNIDCRVSGLSTFSSMFLIPF
jgi:L-gulonolactone oxidase